MHQQRSSSSGDEAEEGEPSHAPLPANPHRVAGSSSQRVPRCLAVNCGADLSQARRYLRRYRLCEAHCRADVVCLEAGERRFCQLCARFHELSSFQEGKRSCHVALARHSRLRRRSRAARREARDAGAGAGEGSGSHDDGGTERAAPGRGEGGRCAPELRHAVELQPEQQEQRRPHPMQPLAPWPQQDARDNAASPPRLADSWPRLVADGAVASVGEWLWVLSELRREQPGSGSERHQHERDPGAPAAAARGAHRVPPLPPGSPGLSSSGG